MTFSHVIYLELARLIRRGNQTTKDEVVLHRQCGNNGEAPPTNRQQHDIRTARMTHDDKATRAPTSTNGGECPAAASREPRRPHPMNRDDRPHHHPMNHDTHTITP
ncbi:hypothetical protein K443DRAFT_4254 [Laccaria amethystina LaAM-08-1]|uniref:Uncharacterized protein n=1 Tax=Laccaria amethystina LaAM-08-1 TaxID=1095629 RepID=A0A0C9XIP3_9AGAR|nr:hypothetical protein K443DRAFT_4254 [Laccaria amethystina LaAM-08-1]